MKRPRTEDPFNGFGFQAASRDWSDTIFFFPCSDKDGEGKTLPSLALLVNFFFSDFTRDFFVLSGSKSVLRPDSWIFF